MLAAVIAEEASKRNTYLAAASAAPMAAALIFLLSLSTWLVHAVRGLGFAAFLCGEIEALTRIIPTTRVKIGVLRGACVLRDQRSFASRSLVWRSRYFLLIYADLIDRIEMLDNTSPIYYFQQISAAERCCCQEEADTCAV